MANSVNHKAKNGKPQGQPDPNAIPYSLEAIARFDNSARLDRMWAAGKLDKYKGEYVISDGETIFAHGKNLMKVWKQAEKKVKAAGKNMDLFTEYYVM